MMTPSHKGYLAPWSSRRENVGLMGTFIVFLMGLPGHSETMVQSAKHFAGQLIQLVLVFLGLSTPVVQAPHASLIPAPAHAPAAMVVRAKVSPVKLLLNSMLLRRDPPLHHYSYVFKGQATFKDQPCPKASVLVRLLSGDTTVTKGTVTEMDGSYSLEMSIDAKDKSPVDWTMEAYTPDFRKVELSGRQIVQREEEQDQQQNKQPIIVTNPVEFIVSLSQ